MGDLNFLIRVRDAPSDLQGGFDLALCVTRGLVDEGCSEGRISLEPKRATAHLDTVREVTKARMAVR